MLKRAVGTGLVIFGLLAGITPIRNLWTISAAWEKLGPGTLGDLSSRDVVDPGDTFRVLWTENLVTLIGTLLIVISGILILAGPRLRLLERKGGGNFEA